MNTIKTKRQASKFGAECAEILFEAVDPDHINFDEAEPLPEDWQSFRNRVENDISYQFRHDLEHAFRQGFKDRLRQLFNLWNANRPAANHCP